MTAAILVVEDSLTVRMDLLEILEAAGLSAQACDTMAAARQALARSRFALVILDVLLPDGDGIELLLEIRAMPSAANTPVLLLSTEAEIRDRIRGLTTGADEYVGKPYDPVYLVARVRELSRGACDIAGPAAPTILLIDDSATFREALKEALEAADFHVLAAATGEDGLRIAADRRPTAIIVDGMLPGIDGATVIRRARLDAVLRRLPCLLLTGSEDRGAEVLALESGADAYVHKEMGVPVILARLHAMLRSAATPGPAPAVAALFGPKKILAVDDSETYLRELAGALRADGYELVLARSGEEALALLAVQRVDCLLLDLIMPGIGGLETCRRVRNTPAMRDIPIILLTVLDDSAATIEGLAAGADDYVAKSIDFGLLRARIFAQIRRKQFEDENRLAREQLVRTEFAANEARAARQLAEIRAALVEELEWKNQELESFSYSVAHDLRAPLRGVDGFSRVLQEDYRDRLDAQGQRYLDLLRDAAQHMSRLIDGLLTLSRAAQTEFRREPVDMTLIAETVGTGLREANPERQVALDVARGMLATGDDRLLTVLFENLLGNAWKFTGRTDMARIAVGVMDEGVFFVRDNGAGFDMASAPKLFGVFQRLHSEREFEGTGVGLATAQRVVRRHGGKIWADGAVGLGATFYFTLRKAAARGMDGAK
jgi:two-component system NtrC family sensor kinase